MMEENNDIVLPGGDALVPWPKQCTKNISQNLFGVIRLVRTYLMTNFSILLHSTYLYTFWMTPSIFPVAYVFKGTLMQL